MQFVARVFVCLMFLGFLVACPAADPTCKIKDDCVAGQVCCKEKAADDQGICKVEADCKTACSTKACTKDSDCTSAESCGKNGCCEANPTCDKNADCAEKQECADVSGKKVCQACARTCGSVLDCSQGEDCERGCCRRPSCKDNSGCAKTTATPVCKTETGECVACLKSEDCQKTNEQSICRNERCATVECTADKHCADGTKTSCNLESYRCVEPPICKTDADCKDPQLNRCDPQADGGRGACKKGNCVPCSTDDECGPAKDLCVGQDKGLKDGKRCLRECATSSDCPTGFICSDAILGGFKICFPPNGFCEDPCSKITCKDTEACVDGVCKPKPGLCVDCSKDGTKACEAGAECLNYPNSQKFCGKKCTTKADCPDDKRGFECVNSQCLAVNGCQ